MVALGTGNFGHIGAGACEGHFSAVNRESAGGSCLKILKIKRCRGELSENSRRCFAENAPPKSQNQDLTSYKFCGRPRKAKPRDISTTGPPVNQEN
jgi:hypothetical protein